MSKRVAGLAYGGRSRARWGSLEPMSEAAISEALIEANGSLTKTARLLGATLPELRVRLVEIAEAARKRMGEGKAK